MSKTDFWVFVGLSQGSLHGKTSAEPTMGLDHLCIYMCIYPQIN